MLFSFPVVQSLSSQATAMRRDLTGLKKATPQREVA